MDTCVQRFADSLVIKKKGSKRCRMEQLFSFVELDYKPSDEQGDALTTYLVGFPADDIPRFTNNFCKTLGDILEELIHIVYREAYPDLYGQDFKSHEAAVKKLKLSLKKGEHIGKWKPDFFLGLIANEIKYRAANGQGSTEQGWGARTLAKLGFTPRMFLFRASPNAPYYGRMGWNFLQSEDAVSKIQSETGIDIIEVIRKASQDPRVCELRTSGSQALFEKEALALQHKIARYGAQMKTFAPDTMLSVQQSLP